MTTLPWKQNELLLSILGYRIQHWNRPKGKADFSYDIDLDYVTLEMKSIVIRWTIVSGWFCKIGHIRDAYIFGPLLSELLFFWRYRACNLFRAKFSKNYRNLITIVGAVFEKIATMFWGPIYRVPIFGARAFTFTGSHLWRMSHWIWKMNTIHSAVRAVTFPPHRM